MKITGYAFPWDFVGDDAALERLIRWRPDTVALAANYHAARLATPLHPHRRILEIPESALYLPLRDEAWEGHLLRPRAPEWFEHPEAWSETASALYAEGIATDAWVVLCHDDTLGYRFPQFCTRNAFGDLYPHALCPAWPDVRRYARTLVEEALRVDSVRGVVLDAAGPIGVEHSTLHDKIEFATWSPVDLALLSLCFCDACRERMTGAGLDQEDLSSRVRAGVGRGVDHLEDVVGEAAAQLVKSHRGALVAGLLAECRDVVDSLAPGTRVTVHASSDPWSTGSFAYVGGPGALEGVDVVVALGWSDLLRDRRLADLRALAGSTTLGVYLRLDRGWPGEFLDEALEHLRLAGVEELHLYHTGLWPASHWRVAEQLTATRGAVS